MFDAHHFGLLIAAFRADETPETGRQIAGARSHVQHTITGFQMILEIFQGKGVLSNTQSKEVGKNGKKWAANA